MAEEPGPIVRLKDGKYKVEGLPEGHSFRGVLHDKYKPKDRGTYFILATRANKGPILYWGGLEESMKKVQALTGMLRDGGTIEAIFTYRGEVARLTFPALNRNELPKIEYLTPTSERALETLVDARKPIP